MHHATYQQRNAKMLNMDNVIYRDFNCCRKVHIAINPHATLKAGWNKKTFKCLFQGWQCHIISTKVSFCVQGAMQRCQSNHAHKKIRVGDNIWDLRNLVSLKLGTNKNIPQYQYSLSAEKVFLEVKRQLFSVIVYTVEWFGCVKGGIAEVRQTFKFQLGNRSKLFIFPGPRYLIAKINYRIIFLMS